MFKTILVATDGSDHAKRAVGLAADLAKKYQAKLIALHVMGNDPLPDDDRHLVEVEFADEIKKFPAAVATNEIHSIGVPTLIGQHRVKDEILRQLIGKHLLQLAEKEIREGGANNVVTVLEKGDPAASIIRVAAENNADLIVLGSRGLGNLGELFLGGVSNRVSHGTDINVLIVK